MSTWVQPRNDPASRIVLKAQTVDENWVRDAATTHFEGRNLAVTARTNRITQEWTLATTWSADQRPDAEAYLTMLRAVALSADTRLDLRIEPANGAVTEVCVQAVEVPQELAPGATRVTVTYRRVE